MMPGCRIYICDESGNVLPQGEEGEIVATTPFHMRGYYKNEEATKALIREDGRIYSGDIGVLDKDGYLTVTGRKKDLIIRGGINISPAEVEDVLSTHPLVAEVVVIGVPDPRAGEELLAVIKTKEEVSADDIREYAAAHLASFKVPKHVSFIDEFPRSVTGKIQKGKLKDMMATDASVAK